MSDDLHDSWLTASQWEHKGRLVRKCYAISMKNEQVPFVHIKMVNEKFDIWEKCR